MTQPSQQMHIPPSRFAALGACLLLAGCSVSVAPLSEQDMTEATATELAQMFAPENTMTPKGKLDLDTLVERAVAANLDNRVQRLEAAHALRRVDVTSLDMLPTLAARAGYSTRSNDDYSTSQVLGRPGPTGIFSRSTDSDVTSGSLSTTWSVLDFAVGYFAARQSANRAYIAEERSRRAGMDVIRQAKESFWRAYAAQQLSGPIDRNIGEALKLLDLIQSGAESGAVPTMDALNQRRTILENVRQLEIFQQELAVARIALAQQVNARPGTRLTLAQTPMRVPALPGTLAELEARAQVSSPALREQRYRIRIALDDVKRSTAEIFPDLSLSAGVDASSDSFLLNDDWSSAGLSIGWNLMNVLTSPQRVRLAESGVALEEARALAVRMAVLAQTHVAYRDYGFARAQYHRARQLSEIDRQIADQTRIREEASVSSQVDRVVTETSAILAKLRVYRAYAELVSAHTAVLATIGADEEFLAILATREAAEATAQKEAKATGISQPGAARPAVASPSGSG